MTSIKLIHLYHVSELPSFLRQGNIPLHVFARFVHPFIHPQTLGLLPPLELWIMPRACGSNPSSRPHAQSFGVCIRKWDSGSYAGLCLISAVVATLVFRCLHPLRPGSASSFSTGLLTLVVLFVLGGGEGIVTIWWVWGDPSVVLTWLSLTISDAEHLFTACWCIFGEKSVQDFNQSYARCRSSLYCGY